MCVGVDYYPEHWPRTRWATDVRLMRKAGFNVVRLAEFNWVQLRGAAALAGYSDWHLCKYAALTRHAYGKGVGWYLGAVMKEDAFYDQLIQCLLRDAGVVAPLQPPAGVELCVRRGARHELLFLVNHTEEPQTINVPAGLRDALRDRACGATVTIERYGVAVLLRPRSTKVRRVSER
jgi:beta-galactosidase